MKDFRRTLGMFVAIFVAIIGAVKIYETIAQTFIPTYSNVFHQYSFDIHFGVFLLALGLTAIWRLQR